MPSLGASLASPLTVGPATPASTTRCVETRWGDYPAYRLRNEHLEAIVVPALGAVMYFSRLGGANWIWTGMSLNPNGKYVSLFSWPNWGGDKTWLAPQSDWTELAGRRWPPDPTWGDPENGPHVATLLPHGGLRVTGPVSPRSGLRIIREYRLDGLEWVTTQMVENINGPARTVALWSVTAVEPPEATYFAPSSGSAHPNGYCKYRTDQPDLDVSRRGHLAIVKATTKHVQKLGFDTPWAALAVQRGRELLIQRAEHPPGNYPHGTDGVGSSVEYYDSGGLKVVPKSYVEEEFLGPLTLLAPGQRASLVTRWRVELLPEKFPQTEADFATLLNWLRAPVETDLGKTSSTP